MRDGVNLTEGSVSAKFCVLCNNHGHAKGYNAVVSMCVRIKDRNPSPAPSSGDRRSRYMEILEASWVQKAKWSLNRPLRSIKSR